MSNSLTMRRFALAAALLLPLAAVAHVKVGRLPLHTFRYKGDPETRIGFMADEVERIDPGAVVTTNLGFAAVDYGRAAQSALRAA